MEIERHDGKDADVGGHLEAGDQVGGYDVSIFEEAKRGDSVIWSFLLTKTKEIASMTFATARLMIVGDAQGTAFPPRLNSSIVHVIVLARRTALGKSMRPSCESLELPAFGTRALFWVGG